MADYAKLQMALTYSENSDYSSPRLKPPLDNWTSSTPTRYEVQYVTVGTAAETFDLSSFTTILLILINNQDATNFVDVKSRYVKASKTFAANKLGFTASAPCTITDTEVDQSTFISTLKFRKGDYAIVSDATEVANSGTFLVQAVVAGTLTLEESAALTLDALDVGTPTVKAVVEQEQPCRAGGYLLLHNVRPDDDLIIRADTAECDVQIFVIGT